ncbi:WecE Predicted pyridoxal phosphate-dependent enzyme apparently involved in regulation of cell wall biogenesis [Methylophilaceae bacterium]
MLIEKLTIKRGSTIGEAMLCINNNEQGICFILEHRLLVGIVTDGDVRRSLLEGANLSDSVDLFMKRKFFSLPVDCTFEVIQKNLEKYKHIPIINNSGEFVDLATVRQYHQIPLVKPVFDGNELEYVTDCILSGWISSQGKYVSQFEEKFGGYVGCQNTLAVSNGTVALHLALVTLGVGPGDEVIVPNLTFAAPINAVLYVGATPVLVDVDPVTFALDPILATAVISNRTRAIIPVHLYGQPADMTSIMAIAKKHNLLVIEDCAEALGSQYHGKHVGTFGDAATFSFFGNKTITTGEGGMLVLREKLMRDRAKMLRDHGMSPERRYWHNEVGYNYRLTNIQSAIGLAQMEKIDFFVGRKRWIAEQYNKRLKNIAHLQLPVEEDNTLNSYWMYTVVLLQPLTQKRDELIELFKQAGIESRPVFYPMHLMPPYVGFSVAGESYSISTGLSEGGINLPSSVYVEEMEIQRVCNVINSFLNITTCE